MKLMVVDDHPMVRAGLRRLFEDDERFHVIEGASGEEGLRLFRSEDPDIVVLDLSMPGLSGLEVIRRMRQWDNDARILVLTMHDDVFHARRALQEGASGYLCKNGPASDVIIAVEQLAAGGQYIDAGLAQRLAFHRNRQGGDAFDLLSTRDLEILRLLSEGKGLQQIAAVLGLSYKTVANNCVRIRSELGAASTADLVRIAIRHGIVGARPEA